jgi:hypothetical protein
MLPLLEPESAKRDDTRARFVEAQPDRLYGWPRRERFDPEGTGELDLERFGIRLAWAIDAQNEVAGGERDVASSRALFDKADAIASWIRANRAGPKVDPGDPESDAIWEQLQVTEIDYEGLVTTSVRGIYVDVDGRTLRS